MDRYESTKLLDCTIVRSRAFMDKTAVKQTRHPNNRENGPVNMNKTRCVHSFNFFIDINTLGPC